MVANNFTDKQWSGAKLGAKLRSIGTLNKDQLSDVKVMSVLAFGKVMKERTLCREFEDYFARRGGIRIPKYRHCPIQTARHDMTWMASRGGEPTINSTQKPSSTDFITRSTALCDLSP
jgi:hypothetical protein